MKVRGNIQLRAYHLISVAVEQGITCGYQRAFKYTETPDPETIKDEIRHYVMMELCDTLDFEGDNSEGLEE